MSEVRSRDRDRLLQARRWEEVLTLFRHMKLSRLPAGMAILNSAVSACETGAQWQVAIQLLTEGEMVDAITWNSALASLSAGHQWQRALDLFLSPTSFWRAAPPAAASNATLGTAFGTLAVAAERATRRGLGKWLSGNVWAPPLLSSLGHGEFSEGSGPGAAPEALCSGLSPPGGLGQRPPASLHSRALGPKLDPHEEAGDRKGCRGSSGRRRRNRSGRQLRGLVSDPFAPSLRRCGSCTAQPVGRWRTRGGGLSEALRLNGMLGAGSWWSVLALRKVRKSSRSRSGCRQRLFSVMMRPRPTKPCDS
eukprot:s4615_g4.t1